MHTHDSGRTPKTEQARTPAVPAAAAPAERLDAAGPMSPDSVLALQRSVGNAAVTRLLGHEEHQHGPGCGHQEPPVQRRAVTGEAGAEEPVVQRRSAVHDVLSSRGDAFSGPVKDEMETRMGENFSGVVFHTGPAARAATKEVGARALTSGNHVVLGDGGNDPTTIAHELTHVVQQRKGPVAGTDHGDGLQMSDPSDRFEKAAEANARHVMSKPLPAADHDHDGDCG